MTAGCLLGKPEGTEGVRLSVPSAFRRYVKAVARPSGLGQAAFSCLQVQPHDTVFRIPPTTHCSLTTRSTSSPPGLRPHSSPPGHHSLPSCLSETYSSGKAQLKCHSSGMPSPKVRINCSVLCPQRYPFITESVASLLVLSWLDQELTEDGDTVLLFAAPLSHNRSE